MTFTFSALLKELKSNIDYNRKALENSLKVNPSLTYQKVNEITHFVGSRYRLNLQIHFPDSRRLSVIDSYGTENLGIVFDKHRKRFPIQREAVKKKALDLFVCLQKLKMHICTKARKVCGLPLLRAGWRFYQGQFTCGATWRTKV